MPLLPAALRELEPVRWLRASPLGTLRLRAHAQAEDDTRAYVYPGVHVHAGRGVRLTGGGRLFFGPRWPQRRFYPGELLLGAGARVHVEDHFLFYAGLSVIVSAGASLHLGSGYLNNHGSIECAQRVQIGRGVFIASHASIRDSDFHTLDPSRPASAPVVIGDHVWIGEGAKIMKGVTIGAGAVVAAATLVGGVPARVIRENVAWR